MLDAELQYWESMTSPIKSTPEQQENQEHGLRSELRESPIIEKFLSEYTMLLLLTIMKLCN